MSTVIASTIAATVIVMIAVGVLVVYVAEVVVDRQRKYQVADEWPELEGRRLERVTDRLVHLLREGLAKVNQQL